MILIFVFLFYFLEYWALFQHDYTIVAQKTPATATALLRSLFLILIGLLLLVLLLILLLCSPLLPLYSCVPVLLPILNFLPHLSRVSLTILPSPVSKPLSTCTSYPRQFIVIKFSHKFSLWWFVCPESISNLQLLRYLLPVFSRWYSIMHFVQSWICFKNLFY